MSSFPLFKGNHAAHGEKSFLTAVTAVKKGRRINITASLLNLSEMMDMATTLVIAKVLNEELKGNLK